MSPQEKRKFEEELKLYLRHLVKSEIETLKKERALRQKTGCSVQDLLKFMNRYAAAEKGKLGGEKKK